MSANPLVADAVDTSTAFGGAGLLESVSDLSSSLRSGNWLASGLSGVGVALDTAATVADPLGSLIAAGLGWLMEHLEPLKGWLNDLTGDAGAVLGHAATWENVAGAMTGAGDELDRVVRADLEAMSGAAITAYAAYANGLADRVRAAGDSASAMGSALRTCSTVVQVVHDLVRDTLAQLVGSIISWAAEVVFTLGLATPVVVTQVATRVSSLATRIGRSVIDVLTSAKSLKNLLEAMRDALARLASGVRGRLPGSGVAGSGAAEAAGDAARAVPTSIRDWGVAFFGPENLRFYQRDNATLGTSTSPYFHMSMDDAAQVVSPSDVWRQTGRAPSVEDEILRAARDGDDPQIFGIAFPRDGLDPRPPTAVDAGGYPHYLEGGHTAVRMDDAPGRPGTGGYLVNSTREYVLDGGPAVPDGSVLFQLMADGSWRPVRRFP